MKLKITNKCVIEKGKQLPNKNVELLGCESLCHCDKVLSDFIKQNNLCDKNNCFKKVFGFNSKFYYKIEKHCKGEVSFYEVGLGHLIKEDTKTLLVRNTPLFSGSKESSPAPLYFQCHNFDSCDDQDLVVTTFTPDHYNQLLADKNCLIFSKDSFLSAPLYVESNCVVGRLDSDIESIPILSLLNKVIKYDGEKVRFFTGQKWITLVEEKDEDTK